MTRPDPQTFKNLLDQSGNVAILLPKNPPYDSVAAALALKLSLEQVGKTATVACSDPMTVEFHRLVGVDSVVSNFGSRNLVITFPGQSEVVDKVSYSLEEGELRLVITPKPNTNGLDHHRVKFISGGTQADLVIFVGISELTDLGQIYTDARDFLQNVRQYYLAGFPLSDSAAFLLSSLNLSLTGDIASNLLAGVEHATNTFQLETSPEVFETVALLLRRGARRQQMARVSDYPAGAVPQTEPNPTWQEPKIYRGTTVS